MILTVTLNAAVDKTYRVENFAVDRVHRSSEFRVAAGGKGLNVARVYRTLGGEAIATGFLGGYNGRYIERAAAQEGMEVRCVRTREESRVCIAIVDPIACTQTEVNEAGPRVSEAEIASLKRRYLRILREQPVHAVTLSGSIPPGVPDSIYAELIGIARSNGVRCVLDASGEPLRMGFAAQPWMVKPNLPELRMLVGEELDSDEEIACAARRLLGNGVDIVCVTLGSRGAICATIKGTLQVTPPPIKFVSAVGSGDSFLAAFLSVILRGGRLTGALRLAAGAGAANAATYGAGFCTKDEIVRLAQSSELRRQD